MGCCCCCCCTYFVSGQIRLQAANRMSSYGTFQRNWKFVVTELFVLALEGGAGKMFYVPAAHWWLSGNVKLGLIWGSVVHCDVFVLVCCAFCMLPLVRV